MSVRLFRVLTRPLLGHIRLAVFDRLPERFRRRFWEEVRRSAERGR